MARGHDVRLSKSLSKILRHDAQKIGLNISSDGFVRVSELLTSPKCFLSKHHYTEQDVINVVQANDKQRFTIRTDTEGNLEIRANQGHSFQVDDLELRPITNPDEFKDVIHGTNWKSWELIKSDGLRPMRRTHVHFAPGVPGEDGVISGMRRGCDVLIYIDLPKALDAGLEFFLSSNRVVLCKGDGEGRIHPRFFRRVLDRKNGCAIAL